MSFLTEHSSRIGAEEFRRLQDEGKTSRPAPTLRPPKPAISKSPLKKAGAGLNVESCFLLPSCPMVYSSTFIHLLETRPAFSFRGAVFVYGLFDWSLSPSCNNWETPLTMKMENVKRFGEAYLGDRTMEERRDPAILPLSITGFSGIRARSSLLWRI